MYQKINSQNQHSKRHYLYYVIALVLLVGVFALLELTNTTHLFHTPPRRAVAYTAGQGTKGEPANNSVSAANVTNQPTTAPNSPPPATQSGDNKGTPAESTVLISPSGTFVSAHKNVPSTAPLSSVCNTSSGATCSIVFTMNSTTKSLPAQTTDRGGATYWNSWTPNSIGLTSGVWKVAAVASLNGQTKTTADALDLEVQ